MSHGKRRRVVALTTALFGLVIALPNQSAALGVEAADRAPADPVKIALRHVEEEAADLGVTTDDVTELAVASSI